MRGIGRQFRLWVAAVLASRLGVALGLFAAPLVGLPALNLPAFLGHAFFAAPAAALALGWAVFLAIGGLWVWLFSALARTMPAAVAAGVTAVLNWLVCGAVVLSTAAAWAPRVARGVVAAPGLFGLRWSPYAPWTLLLAFALSAPGLALATEPLAAGPRA
jgi:hypothetical protein